MSQDAPIIICDGDRYEHKQTGVRAVVEGNLTTPTGLVRLVSTDHTKAAVTITVAVLRAAWRAL